MMNGSSFLHRITEYDPHFTAKHEPTIPQLALLWIWLACLFLLLIRLPKFTFHPRKRGVGDEEKAEVVDKPNVDGAVVNGEAGSGNAGKPENVSKAADEKRFSKVKPPPTFQEFIVHVLQLGVIMLFFYYSDYVKVSAVGDVFVTSLG